MKLQITSQTTVDVPAAQVWQLLAHQFDQIGQWTSQIPRSRAVTDSPAPDGAPVGGRVCSTGVAGFGAVRELFTAYDEAAMRFSYAATDGLPWFITGAENHWSVRPLTASRTLVEARGELTLRPFPGALLRPLLRLQLRRTAAQVFEELKYYLERGEPHPRKLRASRNAARRAA